ncbi:lysozyme inhibitor LprI family protein [Starkeya sp. ORNL1]|uniref:lysozyme inhibitor LprI family protein n=1 Tax=Starkeya sp. ORNL1 TaxID=2709380 RepID=UPI001FEE6D76|nr:lysozyme inhibitor LprI family protein [Starkeya sp. ORNL1]
MAEVMAGRLAAALIIATGMVSAGPSAVHAASFPCSQASAPDEIAICRTPDLNDADVDMSVRYEMLRALLPMGGAGALQDAQRAWLAQRRLCGGDVGCLRSAYAQRIGALKAGFQQIVSRGPY